MPAAISLAGSRRQNSCFGDQPSISFRTISSILNCKTTRQHSPLSGALLDSKDFTLHFHRKPSDLVGNSFEINFDYDTRTNWRAARRKNKRAVLADIAAAPFSLSRLSIPIGPPKCDRCLQQEPEGLSRWPSKIQHAPPPISLAAH
jgi:hypothetical protein